MMITLKDTEYFARCISAGALLPVEKKCLDCDREFTNTFDAEVSHDVIRFDNGFTIIRGCEGYHQIRF